VRYYIILSTDLGYMNQDCLMEMVDEVSRLLTAYIAPLLNPRAE
jgi:hypothetical protein